MKSPDSPDPMSTTTACPPGQWAIFCSIVDNYGDIGVSWRLARQLANEYHFSVELWVDDWHTLTDFLRPLEPNITDTNIVIENVRLRHWPAIWPDDPEFNRLFAETSVVLEMFGCAIPASVLEGMTSTCATPRWINIEYLSAEHWVGEMHNLPSPQALTLDGRTKTLQKTFFMPGFTSDTGGLIREQNLVQQHHQWQRQQQALRQQTLDAFDLENTFGLWISLFCYQSSSLTSWLQTLANGSEPVLCIAPEGRMAAMLGPLYGLENCPPAGKILRKGALTVLIHPFVSQQNYDRLLSLCDLNLVRGEDSFVRAQWAGKPFIWHIYPQHDDAHLTKLQAFLALFAVDDDNSPATQVWRELSLQWNLDDDIGNLWQNLRPNLPALLQSTRNWQQKLAAMPDLTTALVRSAGFAP